MAARVWISEWQLQCCGQAFAVGAAVTWTAVLVDGPSWFHDYLDDATAASVTHEEDHHGVRKGPLDEVRGTVRAIDAVYLAYRSDGRTAFPVEGSAELEPRTRANGWEPQDAGPAGRRFAGYLVTLDT